MIIQRRKYFTLLIIISSWTSISLIGMGGRTDYNAQPNNNQQHNGFIEQSTPLDERLDPTGRAENGVLESASALDERLDPTAGTENGILETAPALDERLDPTETPETTTSEEKYISTCSDETYEQKFDVKISGFVKYDAFMDSRQIIGYNHGLIMLVPRIPIFDPTHTDINDQPQWNMLGLQSRLIVDVTGPKLGHAKTAARVGFDFADPLDRGLFRIRFAYMQFDFDHIKHRHTKLLLGHYYHPLSLDEAYPTTLGFSEGLLFDPFAYAGQATVHYTFDNITLIGSLNSEWNSFGGQNAAFPNLFFGGHLKFCDAHFVGAGIDFHREVPRIATNPFIATSGQSFATSSAINSWTGYVFTALNFEHFKLKARFTYVENGIRYCLLGGFAAKASDYNAFTDERHYTNLRALAFWTELIYRYKKAEVGVFIGYTKNIGSRDALVTNLDGTADLRFIDVLYEGAAQTDRVLKIQPRLKYYLAPVEFGVELEFCRASYGTVNKFGRVDNAEPVSVARILFAILYKF